MLFRRPASSAGPSAPEKILYKLLFCAAAYFTGLFQRLRFFFRNHVVRAAFHNARSRNESKLCFFL